MATSNIVVTAKQTTEKLLQLLRVESTEVSVEEIEGVLNIQIQVPDQESGQLIGYHGETLNALQHLINQLVNRGREEWVRITVNINNYRDQREVELRQMAKNAADRSVSTGDEIEMPYLTSYERRIIHVELADRSDIATYSEGEEQNRRLIIAPKKELEEK